MATQLSIADVQSALNKLGYYDGAIDGNALDSNFRDDLRRFQRDYGLERDGQYGPITEGRLLPLLDKLKASSAPPLRHLCRWQLTYYFVPDQAAYQKGVDMVPVRSPSGKVLAEVEAAFFSKMALEGTGRLRDGQLLNVAGGGGTGPASLPCDPDVFAPCFRIAQRNNWIPDKAGYAGILCDAGGTKATHARCFDFREAGATGWPVERLGIPLDPWRTIATDLGKLNRHDPQFKGKGGVVPPGTKVFILESVGWKLPDNTTHDGWWVANDTGGGIFGAHFDLFVGTTQLAKLNQIPGRGHIWFEGCEDRLGVNYFYGLG